MTSLQTHLTIGQEAPDFELKDQNGNLVKLSSFRGEKNVVILFYPFSFTGTCTGELCAIRDDLAPFQNDGVQVLAISCDSMHIQRIFAEQESYKFPILSDFWPHGVASQLYGIFNEDAGCAMRGTFIIDKQGIIRWSVVQGFGDPRNNGDYKSAIAAL